MVKRDKQRQPLVFVALSAALFVGCAEDEQGAMPASMQEFEMSQGSMAGDGHAEQRRPAEEGHAALWGESAPESLSDASLAMEELDREMLSSGARFFLEEKACDKTNMYALFSFCPGCDTQCPARFAILQNTCTRKTNPSRVECIVGEDEQPELYRYILLGLPTDVRPPSLDGE